MLPKIPEELKAKIWDYMYVSGMILASSIGITAAVVIPFAVFSGLHKVFCS